MGQHACSFCFGVATLGPFGGAYVCSSCPAAIAKLALRVVGPSVARIWAADAPGPPVEIRESSRDRSADPPDFRPFVESVSAAIAPGDVTSRADLAIAYLEMGLNVDARREAATAIGTDLHATRVGLSVLLSPRLLNPDGLRWLRAELSGRVPLEKLGPTNATWSQLYGALAKLAKGCGALFAFVIDEGNGLWCVGLADTPPTTSTVHENRAADRFYVAEMVPRLSALRRGAPMDIARTEGDDRYIAISFASIYAVVVWFDAPFEPALARARTRRAIPEIEALTLSFPPPAGPGDDEGAVKVRA